MTIKYISKRMKKVNLKKAPGVFVICVNIGKNSRVTPMMFDLRYQAFYSSIKYGLFLYIIYIDEITAFKLKL